MPKASQHLTRANAPNPPAKRFSGAMLTDGTRRVKESHGRQGGAMTMLALLSMTGVRLERVLPA
jgi:hypothetical protein